LAFIKRVGAAGSEAGGVPEPPPLDPSDPNPSTSSNAASIVLDAEASWLTGFLPFSRLSPDAAAWLSANAPRATAAAGDQLLAAGGDCGEGERESG
jgi:hypothetical protein